MLPFCALYAITVCGVSTGKGATEERRARKRKLNPSLPSKIEFSPPAHLGALAHGSAGEKAGCYAKGRLRNGWFSDETGSSLGMPARFMGVIGRATGGLAHV